MIQEISATTLGHLARWLAWSPSSSSLASPLPLRSSCPRPRRTTCSSSLSSTRENSPDAAERGRGGGSSIPQLPVWGGQLSGRGGGNIAAEAAGLVGGQISP